MAIIFNAIRIEKTDSPYVTQLTDYKIFADSTEGEIIVSIPKDRQDKLAISNAGNHLVIIKDLLRGVEYKLWQHEVLNRRAKE